MLDGVSIKCRPKNLLKTSERPNRRHCQQKSNTPTRLELLANARSKSRQKCQKSKLGAGWNITQGNASPQPTWATQSNGAVKGILMTLYSKRKRMPEAAYNYWINQQTHLLEYTINLKGT